MRVPFFSIETQLYSQSALSIYTVRTIRPFKLFKWKAKRSALVNVSTGKFGSSQNKVRFGRTDRSDRVNGKRTKLQCH